ncbi:MAG TPA: hypothetical protein PLA31_04795, partial [Clostridia bacterium]|nr:hypothetical protein [Clostridia bacterium]
MRRIMVMNLGSTSFKFKLFEMDENERCLASGSVESIGAAGSCTVSAMGRKVKDACASANH